MLRRSITPVSQTLFRDAKFVDTSTELFQKYSHQALRKTQIRRKFRSEATYEKYEKIKKILEQYFSISKPSKFDNESKAKIDNCKKCEKILEEIFGKAEEKINKNLATTVKEKDEELITKIETIKDAKLEEIEIKTDNAAVPPKVLGYKHPNKLLSKRKDCVSEIKHNEAGKEPSILIKEIGQFGVPIDREMNTSSDNKSEKIIQGFQFLKKPKEASDNLNKEKAIYRVHVFRETIKNSKATKQIENFNANINRPYNGFLTKNENREIHTFYDNNRRKESNNLKLDTKATISKLKSKDLSLNNKKLDIKKSHKSFSAKSKENMAQSPATQLRSGGETIKIKEECFVKSDTGSQITNHNVKNLEKDKTIVAATVPLAPPKNAETEECSPIVLSEKVSLNELLKKVRQKNKMLHDKKSGNLQVKCPRNSTRFSSIKCPPYPCNPPSSPRCPPPRGPELPKCPPKCPPPERKSSPCHPPSHPQYPTPQRKSPCHAPSPPCSPPQRKSPCHAPSPPCSPPQRKSPCHAPSPPCSPPQRKSPPCQPTHHPKPPICPPVSRPSFPGCPPLPKAAPTPRRPSCPPPYQPHAAPTCPPAQPRTCPPPPKCKPKCPSQPKCPDPCKKFRSISLPTDFIILSSQPKIKVAFESPAVKLVDEQLKMRSKNYEPCVPIPCCTIPKEVKQSSQSSCQSNPPRIPPPKTNDLVKENSPKRKFIPSISSFWLFDV